MMEVKVNVRVDVEGEDADGGVGSVDDDDIPFRCLFQLRYSPLSDILLIFWYLLKTMFRLLWYCVTEVSRSFFIFEASKYNTFIFSIFTLH